MIASAFLLIASFLLILLILTKPPGSQLPYLDKFIRIAFLWQSSTYRFLSMTMLTASMRHLHRQILPNTLTVSARYTHYFHRQ